MYDHLKHRIPVYTDGACTGNPGPGGWAFAITDTSGKVVYTEAGNEIETTNNRMELQAVISAIATIYCKLIDKRGEELKGVSIDLYTDSQYVKNGIEKTDIRLAKPELPNKDLREAIAQAKSERRVNIAVTRIRGHDKNEINNLVDKLAVEAKSILLS